MKIGRIIPPTSLTRFLSGRIIALLALVRANVPISIFRSAARVATRPGEIYEAQHALVLAIKDHLAFAPARIDITGARVDREIMIIV